MSETKRTKNIAFRVTDEDYERIEKAATAAGDDANSWCRKAALSRLLIPYADLVAEFTRYLDQRT